MRGKINKYGCLEVERGGVMKKQWCPLNNAEGECGDWCPLFCEPEEIENSKFGKYELALCHQTLYFNELIDQRGEPK